MVMMDRYLLLVRFIAQIYHKGFEDAIIILQKAQHFKEDGHCGQSLLSINNNTYIAVLTACYRRFLLEDKGTDEILFVSHGNILHVL